MNTPLVRLRDAAAALRFDLMTPADVVGAAAEVLAEGPSEYPSDSPLVELAWATGSREEITEILARALEAEGAVLPSDHDAGRIMARRVCRAILDGEVSPVDGAVTIYWRIVSPFPGLLDEFAYFGGLAEGWQDEPLHRAEYEADILQAASAVLSETS